MIVPDLTEFKLFPVVDRGVANSERIAIQANISTDVNQYGLMVGHMQADGSTLPLRDNLYWFGNGQVNVGDWIILYTGGGEPRNNKWHNPPGSSVYVVHWGRSSTVFANSHVVPILFKTDTVAIDHPPLNVPQLSS